VDISPLDNLFAIIKVGKGRRALTPVIGFQKGIAVILDQANGKLYKVTKVKGFKGLKIVPEPDDSFSTIPFGVTDV
jgi:hypothetical protein